MSNLSESEILWNQLFGDLGDNNAVQERVLPVPEFADIGALPESPLISGSVLPNKDRAKGLAVPISDFERLMEWIDSPTTQNAKDIRETRQAQALAPDLQHSAAIGSLIHVMDSLIEAAVQPMGRFVSDVALVKQIFPTFPEEKQLEYANIIGGARGKGTQTPKHLMEALDAAFRRDLAQKVVRQKEATGGWTQGSWLAPAQPISHEALLLDTTESDAYRQKLEALISAWGKPAIRSDNSVDRVSSVGLMREVTIVDNQRRNGQETDLGWIQVRGIFDRVRFAKMSNSGKIGIEVSDLKTGKQPEGQARETESFQMMMTALVANRFTQGLVGSHQAAIGKKRPPSGFEQNSGAFRITKDLKISEQPDRLLGVWIRRLDSDEGVFREDPIDLGPASMEQFRQQYEEICRQVGQQRKTVELLLGRKSTKK